MTEKYFLIGSKKHLAYLDLAGSGVPLLLIHGLMVSGAMYQPILSILNGHHRLIVPDLRGHGHSSALPGPSSVEQLASDLAHLLDELQVDAVHVLGYSQGGAVAQQFAHTHPRRVKSLILACTFSCNVLSRREQIEARLSPWLVRLLGVRRMGRLAINHSGGQPVSPETAHWLEEIIATQTTANMVAAIESMNTFDSRQWLHQIVCPTLVIAGAEDEAVPLTHSQRLAEGIPNTHLQVIEGAGHFLIFTHTDSFVQAMEAFLASVNNN